MTPVNAIETSSKLMGGAASTLMQVWIFLNFNCIRIIYIRNLFRGETELLLEVLYLKVQITRVKMLLVLVFSNPKFEMQILKGQTYIRHLFSMLILLEQHSKMQI
jgi:hypothetical protein